MDDALDYSSSADALGKNVGDDLAEGKPTLPLIHALHNGTEGERKLIRSAIENGGLDDLEPVRHAIESTGGLDYTARLAREQAEAAVTSLAVLPDSVFKQALSALAHIAVERTH